MAEWVRSSIRLNVPKYERIARAAPKFEADAVKTRRAAVKTIIQVDQRSEHTLIVSGVQGIEVRAIFTP